MSQFNGTLFDESLFGGGRLVSVSGAAGGRGASSGAPQTAFSHTATLRGHSAAGGAPLRPTPATGRLAGAGAFMGAGVRIRLSVAIAAGTAGTGGNGVRGVHAAGHVPGLGRLAGAPMATYAEAGALRGTSVASATLLQLTLPPPSRAGIRITAWLRPGT